MLKGGRWLLQHVPTNILRECHVSLYHFRQTGFRACASDKLGSSSLQERANSLGARESEPCGAALEIGPLTPMLSSLLAGSGCDHGCPCQVSLPATGQ